MSNAAVSIERKQKRNDALRGEMKRRLFLVHIDRLIREGRRTYRGVSHAIRRAYRSKAPPGQQTTTPA